MMTMRTSFFLALLLSLQLSGQVPIATSTGELIKELRSGKERSDVIQELGKRIDEPMALEALENSFRAGDKIRKKQVALAISPVMRLKDWMYQEVESYAARAIRSDVPAMNYLDSGGQPIRGVLTPEFETWCQDQHPATDCVALVTYTFIPDILTLGALRDPRSIPLLREGLQVKNLQIVFVSAAALSGVPDGGVIDDIVKVSRDARLSLPTRELVRKMLANIDAEDAPVRLRLLLDGDAYNKYLKERAEIMELRAKRGLQK